jgi:hypothetical protein
MVPENLLQENDVRGNAADRIPEIVQNEASAKRKAFMNVEREYLEQDGSQIAYPGYKLRIGHSSVPRKASSYAERYPLLELAVFCAAGVRG